MSDFAALALKDQSAFHPRQAPFLLAYRRLNPAESRKVLANEDLSVNLSVKASINEDEREQIARHHSATHLLHYALREILGTHITQAGSLVEFNKLRFDFTHPKALSEDEISKIENLVNLLILKADNAKTEILDLEDAKKSGAIALFSEKYSGQVRVLTLGKSKELCGGTHVKNTAQIGAFFIVKESGVSAGVRRIEAVASKAALNYAKSFICELHDLKNALKTNDILSAFERLKKENLDQKICLFLKPCLNLSNPHRPPDRR